jgi:aerobic carbon-monoxide dehydrogenase large subunit
MTDAHGKLNEVELPGMGNVRRGKSVGARVTRLEDPSLLLGDARYVGDITLPRMVHVSFVRSSHAHASLAGIDASSAQRAPQVVTVLTGEDLAAHPLEDAAIHPTLPKTPQPSLATDRVLWAGEAIAALVAESPYAAEDAADQVVVDYEPLPAVHDVKAALADDAPRLHHHLPSNILISERRRSGDVEGIFRNAEHVFHRQVHTNRLSAAPIETRGCVADYGRSTGHLTVWSSTQTPDLLRLMLSHVLEHPHHKLRVIAPHVGGGFGPKMSTYPEEVVVAYLARQLNRPVRWIEDRRESLLAMNHSKEQVVDLEIATRSDGRFLGFRAKYLSDSGAYSFNSATALIEPQLAAGLMPGLYDVQVYEYELIAAMTNKTPIGPYRGVGWTAGHTARELLIDEIARALEIDPAELRRKNMIRSDMFPYRSATGHVYDSGSYEQSLDTALDKIDYEGIRREQDALRRVGRHVGVGISPYVEPTAYGTEIGKQSGYPYTSHDNATVTMDPTGKVRVALGICSQGQGHGTTFAQVVADALGVRPEDVEVVAGDTERAPFGLGTYASRGAVIGGGALALAAGDVRKKVLDVAGDLLEASPADLILEDSKVSVSGVPTESLDLGEIAAAAYFEPGVRQADSEPFLSSTRFYDPRPTFSNGCFAAVVDVDVETGEVRILRFVAVEDCGTVINPMIVEGQIRGAVAQGVGAALLEDLPYDDAAQPLATTFMDYLLPLASDVPSIDVYHLETPAPETVGGIKGMGESGLVASPAALANAVLDALGAYDPEQLELPLTPERVVRLADRL